MFYATLLAKHVAGFLIGGMGLALAALLSSPI